MKNTERIAMLAQSASEDVQMFYNDMRAFESRLTDLHNVAAAAGCDVKRTDLCAVLLDVSSRLSFWRSAL